MKAQVIGREEEEKERERLRKVGQRPEDKKTETELRGGGSQRKGGGGGV